jgi:hypothetical protein
VASAASTSGQASGATSAALVHVVEQRLRSLSTRSPAPGTTAATSPASTYSTVSGKTTQQANGMPYVGASVEFVNLAGHYQVNTKTDRNSEYRIQLPPGLWRAEAVDVDPTKPNAVTTTSTSRAGGAGTITVPPSTTVDFTETSLQ